MSAMQMTTALTEQEAGLFKGLFSTAVEADAEQFSDTLKQTLTAFNQALVDGDQISAEWLQRLEQQAADQPSLQQWLVQLGLIEQGTAAADASVGDSAVLTTADLPVDELTSVSAPLKAESMENAEELPLQAIAPDGNGAVAEAPDNLLNFLVWAEKTLQAKDRSSASAKDGAILAANTAGSGVLSGLEVLADNNGEALAEVGVSGQDDNGEDGKQMPLAGLAEPSEDLSAPAVVPEIAQAGAQGNGNQPKVEAGLQAPLVAGTVTSAGRQVEGSDVSAMSSDGEQPDVSAGVSANEALRAMMQPLNRLTPHTSSAEKPLADGSAALSTADLAARNEQLDEAKKALFAALDGDMPAAEGTDADLPMTPLAKAVAMQLAANSTDPSAALQTPLTERSELTTATSHQGQTQSVTAQSATQQARPDIQTLLQQAVDIRHQEQATNQLRERMLLMVAGKLDRAEIRLDPPELGSLMVRVQVQNEQAQVHIVAQNQHAKEMLEQSLPRLREMLQQQGIALGDTEVSHQGPSDQQPGEADRDPAEVWERQQNSMLEAEIDIPVIQRQIAQGRVDYFA